MDLLVHMIEGYVMKESKLDESFMKRLGADSQMTGNLPHWNQGITSLIMLRLSYFKQGFQSSHITSKAKKIKEVVPYVADIQPI